jgi:hypothetical protein
MTILLLYTSDGKRIPAWETLRQELVVWPHLIGGHGKLLSDVSVSVRHIGTNRHM